MRRMWERSCSPDGLMYEIIGRELVLGCNYCRRSPLSLPREFRELGIASIDTSVFALACCHGDEKNSEHENWLRFSILWFGFSRPSLHLLLPLSSPPTREGLTGYQP